VQSMRPLLLTFEHFPWTPHLFDARGLLTLAGIHRQLGLLLAWLALLNCKATTVLALFHSQVVVWDLVAHSCLPPLAAHKADILSSAFSPDCTMLATCSQVGE
jgi:WD40 repeat protein